MQKRPSKNSSRGREGAHDVLGPRELNRATLERQMLLHRRNLSAVEAVEHLVGMQAQAPAPPYVGLWTRLRDFHPDELARLILERRAVRIALMRNTVHLVSASDCLALRPLMQPVFDRTLFSTRANRAHLEGVDAGALVATGRALLEERPRTAKELGELLQEQWPERDPAALARAIRHLVPLVQVPPRGLWGKSGPAAHTTAESWLGSPLDPAPSIEHVVLRYLGAFGPATVKDVQTWSGLTRLGEVIERIRPRLRIFRDERGKELFDLPDAPMPGSAALLARVRQPQPLSRRSHSRHRRGVPQSDRLEERHGSCLRARRRFCPRDVEDQAEPWQGHPRDQTFRAPGQRGSPSPGRSTGRQSKAGSGTNRRRQPTPGRRLDGYLDFNPPIAQAPL